MGECFQCSLVSRAATQQQQQQRCVCIVMPTSKGYIITEGRRRGLWEVVDRMRGSDWLPQQSDFRRGGAVGEVDCSPVSFSDINLLFSVTWNSSCPAGAAVFRVCWRLQNQNDAGFRQNIGCTVTLRLLHEVQLTLSQSFCHRIAISIDLLSFAVCPDRHTMSISVDLHVPQLLSHTLLISWFSFFFLFFFLQVFKEQCWNIITVRWKPCYLQSVTFVSRTARLV